MERIYIARYLEDGDFFIDSKKRIWQAFITIGHWKKDYYLDASTYVNCRWQKWFIGADKCRLIGKVDPDVEIKMYYQKEEKIVTREQFIEFIESKKLIKVPKR